jgi:hypothetical protein
LSLKSEESDTHVTSFRRCGYIDKVQKTQNRIVCNPKSGNQTITQFTYLGDEALLVKRKTKKKKKKKKEYKIIFKTKTCSKEKITNCLSNKPD